MYNASMVVNQGPPPYLQNRYRLVQQLGRGGMGWVYRAQDELLGREVAIKFLSPELTVNQTARARFAREAQSLARLSHPHILTLFDAGREEEWDYLILEYVPGQNLHQYRQAENGRLSLTTTLTITQQLLQALAYAHKQGLIHRDIKPENVMMDENGRVKLADFGLALLQQAKRITQVVNSQVMLGTLLYLAPECILGKTADHRSDLYALGALMFEMLTGQPPFTSSSPAELLANVLNEPTPLPSNLNQAIPTKIDGIVMRLLEKKPATRFQTAEDVLTALSGNLTPTTPPSNQPQTMVEQLMRTSAFMPAVKPDAVLPDLLHYAALADTAVAVETERRRLAQLLHEQIADPLNLLLAQSQLYEQSFAANPSTRMALSVLTSLVRQAVQQAHDLEAALHPELLENLGLEPALEALVSREMRRHGVTIRLQSPRLADRLPPPMELALYRLTQDVLHQAITARKATNITVQLQVDTAQIQYQFQDNGLLEMNAADVETAVSRLKQLGGHVDFQSTPTGALDLQVRFENQSHIQLTPREQDVMHLVVAGMTNKAIAQQLHISPRTVNFHLDNIYAKLGVNSRTEAAVLAMRLQLLHQNPG